MPKHPDTLAEAFCQAYAQCLDAKEAYLTAYQNFGAGEFMETRDDVGRRHESMMRRKGVKDRINELLKSRSMASESRVRHEFEAIAFAKITDVASWSSKEMIDEETGLPITDDNDNVKYVQHLELIDSDELSTAAKASIKSIKQTKYGLAIEMHDKLAALNKLSATHPGLNGKGGPNDGDVEVPVLTLFNTEDGEIAQQLEDMQNREDMAEAYDDEDEEDVDA